jgi:nucleoside-diphosphate-sugar epimerase
MAEVEVFMGDVRDPNGVRTALKDADAVMHLAALRRAGPGGDRCPGERDGDDP